ERATGAVPVGMDRRLPVARCLPAAAGVLGVGQQPHRLLVADRRSGPGRGPGRSRPGQAGELVPNGRAGGDGPAARDPHRPVPAPLGGVEPRARPVAHHHGYVRRIGRVARRRRLIRTLAVTAAMAVGAACTHGKGARPSPGATPSTTAAAALTDAAPPLIAPGARHHTTGGSARVGVWGEPDPAAPTLAGAAVRALVLPQLFVAGVDGRWRSALVDPGSDHVAPDLRSATFKLRPRAVWSN